MPNGNNQRAPGTGLSRKAKARRNRKQQTVVNTTTITTQQPNPAPANRQPKRKQKNRKRNPKVGGSPYLHSILDPRNGSGIKVPDPFSMRPTGTFQLTYDNVYTAVNDTTASNPQGYILGFFLDPYNQNYNSIVPGTSSSSPTWASGVQMVGSSSAQAIYDTWRVVSAAIEVMYTGTSANDQGLICYFESEGTVASLTSNPLYPPVTFSQAIALADNRTVAARQPAKICWRPRDNASIEFTSGTTGSVSVNKGGIGFYATGLTSTSSFYVRVIVNYEGTAKTDTTNFVNLTASPSDNSSWMSAKNYLATSPMLVSTLTLGGAALSKGLMGQGANYMNNIYNSIGNERMYR